MMRQQFLVLVLAAALGGAAAPPASAQTRPAAVSKGYKAPRNAFGQPDFSGVWSNATITRL